MYLPVASATATNGLGHPQSGGDMSSTRLRRRHGGNTSHATPSGAIYNSMARCLALAKSMGGSPRECTR